MPPNEHEYLLWCCLSDVPESCFSVKISKLATVDELKTAIDPERHPIALVDIKLWKVCFPINDYLTKQVHFGNPSLIHGSKQLVDPSTPLSELFSGQRPDRHIDIIVQRASSERRLLTLSALGRIDRLLFMFSSPMTPYLHLLPRRQSIVVRSW